MKKYGIPLVIIIVGSLIAGSILYINNYKEQDPKLGDDNQQNKKEIEVRNKGLNFEIHKSYLAGSDNNYYKLEGSVYWLGKINEIPNADLDTFVALSGYAAKDKNFAYIGKQVVEGVSPNDLEVIIEDIDFRLYTDQKRVFFNNNTEVFGADPSTLEIIDSHHLDIGIFSFKDSKRVFYSKDGVDVNVFIDANPETFQLIETGSRPPFADQPLYAKDDQFVYYLGGDRSYKKLTGADPDTFEILESIYYTKDKDNVFYHNSPILNADPDTFEVLLTSYVFSKDKNGVYLYGELEPIIDPSTFEQLDGCYFKDKNNIYCSLAEMGPAYISPLKDVDVESFETIHIDQTEYDGRRDYPNILGKDKDNYYRWFNAITD